MPDLRRRTADAGTGLPRAFVEIPVLAAHEGYVVAAHPLKNLSREEARCFDRSVTDIAASLQRLTASPEPNAEALFRHDDSRSAGDGHFDALRDHGGVQDHVTVDEEKRRSGGNFSSPVPLGASLRSCNEHDIAQTFRDFLRLVGRAVVDDKQLEISMSLRPDTL